VLNEIIEKANPEAVRAFGHEVKNAGKAIDYAIKPVLSTLGASDVLQGVYLVDQQFRIENGQPVIADEVRQRLDESLAQFAVNLEIRTTVH
jgi:NAD(P)H-dependent FMN reductase